MDQSTTPATDKSTETTPTEGDKAAPGDKPSLLNDKGKEPDKAPSGAPDKYADFTLPEGFELDAEALKESTDLFKSMNLDQPSAQKLVDFYVAKTKEALDAPFKVWQDTQEQWRAAVQQDPEIGGKLEQVKARVGRLLDSAGDQKLVEGFRQAMDLTGAGSNPFFIRMMNKLAERFTEGSFVRAGGQVELDSKGNPTTSRPPSIAAAMFPNLKSSQG